MEIKEIENKNTINTDKSNYISNKIISNMPKESILTKIFIHKNIGDKTEYQPLLSKSNTLGKELMNIFFCS